MDSSPRPGPIARLYDFVLRLGGHRRAEPALAAVAFAESSVFPVPPDVMLLPMVIAKPRRWWRIAAIATAASAAGGLLGYAIGYGLWEVAGRPILALYGLEGAEAEYRSWYEDRAMLIVFLAGLTPIPYKAITILSGVAGMAVPPFLLASAAGRGLRFFAVAAVLALFGRPVEAFIRRNARLATVSFLAALVGGFVVLGML